MILISHDPGEWDGTWTLLAKQLVKDITTEGPVAGRVTYLLGDDLFEIDGLMVGLNNNDSIVIEFGAPIPWNPPGELPAELDWELITKIQVP